MPSPLRAILIGGTSHTGKSTLAGALAARLGGTARSTDTLARHPGRPWATLPMTVPLHVVEHYGTLSTEEQMASVLAHYRRLATQIVDLVGAATAEAPLLLEGSALLPETVAPLIADDVVSVTLLAPSEVTTARIYAESRHAERDAEACRLIDGFLARAIAFEAWVGKEAQRYDLPVIQLAPGSSIDALADQLLRLPSSVRGR